MLLIPEDEPNPTTGFNNESSVSNNRRDVPVHQHTTSPTVIIGNNSTRHPRSRASTTVDLDRPAASVRVQQRRVVSVRGCPYPPILGRNSVNDLSSVPPIPTISRYMPATVELLVKEFLRNNLMAHKHQNKKNWEPRMKSVYSRRLYIYE